MNEAEMREMLREAHEILCEITRQWDVREDLVTCVWCDYELAEDGGGHAPDCQLRAWLDKAEAAGIG